MIKITLHCEYLKFLNGILFRNSAMGFLTSYFNQMKALKIRNIDFTEDLNVKADIFQANTQGIRTIWLTKKFKKRGAKIIIYAHATAEELFGGFRIFHFFAPLYKHYLSYVYNLADAVACPSVYTARLLNKKYNVPKEKTIFISNGVNVNKFVFSQKKREEFRKKLGVANNRILVINTAMAIRKKGIDTFIELAKEFPEVKFIWFGNIFKSIFAAKIPPHSDNLIFYGYVSDIVAAYSATDIFLFPSYEENQGISVLEAGAIGLPILIRDIPVYYEWMKDGENCLKAETDEEFKKQLSRLIASNDLRRKLGEAARQMIIRDHSLEAVGEKLEKVYNSLLAEKQGHEINP